jgi:hypothetical protein
MLIKLGLIATVGTVLGTGAVASAQEPCVENTYEQPVYQQPVYQQPVYQQPVYQRPVYRQPVYQPAPVVIPAPVVVRAPVYRPVYRPVHYRYRNVWAGPHHRNFHRW